MSRALVILWLALSPGIASAAAPHAESIPMPDFPLPRFAIDRYGQPQEMGMLRLLRELHRGGVRAAGDLVTADSDYAVVSSDSLGLLSAWIEAACLSGGIQLPLARSHPYNGAVYAGLLKTATNIAASRRTENGLAIPVGVMICTRRNPWGILPGDNERDAYVLIATERGFVVFDPPTRQAVLLADFPNNSEVVKILI